MPRSPWEALAAGQGCDVTLMGGHTRNEWRTMMAMAGRLRGIADSAVDADLRALTPDGGKAYRAAFPEAVPWQLYEMLMTDWSFRIPILQLLDAQVTGGGRAFAYELAWTVPELGGTLGAPHASDLPLVFGNLTKGAATLFLDGNVDEAERLSARMRGAWTSFAATGNPGWDPYDTTRRITRVFDSRRGASPALGRLPLSAGAATAKVTRASPWARRASVPATKRASSTGDSATRPPDARYRARTGIEGVVSRACACRKSHPCGSGGIRDSPAPSAATNVHDTPHTESHVERAPDQVGDGCDDRRDPCRHREFP
ncbi:carboxylesterase family protein [Streptosporangium sp. G11]|uniref:carboxylesterase family protein n=1 Tax=Streptosporangium sp. G11 TaxID=3436926 RepID=UPI003EB970CE